MKYCVFKLNVEKTRLLYMHRGQWKNYVFVREIRQQ